MNYLNESSLIETDMVPSIHRKSSVNNNIVEDDINENKSGIYSGVRRIGDST